MQRPHGSGNAIPLSPTGCAACEVLTHYLLFRLGKLTLDKRC